MVGLQTGGRTPLKKVRSPGTGAVWVLGHAPKSWKGPGGTGAPPSLATLEDPHRSLVTPAQPSWRSDTPFHGGPEAWVPGASPYSCCCIACSQHGA